MPADKATLRAKSLQQAEATLAWIRQQEVSANPANYALGYERLNGNADIARELGQIKDRGELLERQLHQLYKQYFQLGDEKQLQAFRQQLHEILQQALGATKGSHASFSRFIQELSHSSSKLEQHTDDLQLVKTVVAELIQETNRMNHTVRSLESGLNDATSEIEQLRQQYDSLRDEIFSDPLTGVLNRRGLDRAINRILINEEMHGLEHALLMIDLDNFKPLNDTYGHVVGDQILCFIAKTLTDAVRGSDAVGRYGGDEFSIVLPETGKQGAVRVAANILEALRKSQLKRRSTGELLGKVTASIGIAIAKPDDHLESLIERADKALYRVKSGGKDSIVCAD